MKYNANYLLSLFQNQIQEMKQAQTQNTAQLRSMLLDPAINLVFQRMAKEMEEHKEKLKQKQNELNAWKFTPDRCFLLPNPLSCFVNCKAFVRESRPREEVTWRRIEILMVNWFFLQPLKKTFWESSRKLVFLMPILSIVLPFSSHWINAQLWKGESITPYVYLCKVEKGDRY